VDFAAGVYRVELDSSEVASGLCSAPVLFSGHAGADFTAGPLRGSSEECTGELVGPTVDFPSTTTVSLEGTLHDGGAPVYGRVSIVLQSPMMEKARIDGYHHVAEATTDADGNFLLEGRVAEDRCDRLRLQYRLQATATADGLVADVPLNGCGEQSLVIEVSR